MMAKRPGSVTYIDYEDGTAKDEPPVEQEMEDDGLGGLSSARDVRTETRKARQAEEQFEADLLHVLSSAQGRRLVADLFEFSGVTRTIFDSDPLIMARWAGRQEYPRELMNLMLLPPFSELYATMVAERLRDDRNRSKVDG